MYLHDVLQRALFCLYVQITFEYQKLVQYVWERVGFFEVAQEMFPTLSFNRAL